MALMEKMWKQKPALCQTRKQELASEIQRGGSSGMARRQQQEQEVSIRKPLARSRVEAWRRVWSREGEASQVQQQKGEFWGLH